MSLPGAPAHYFRPFLKTVRLKESKKRLPAFCRSCCQKADIDQFRGRQSLLQEQPVLSCLLCADRNLDIGDSHSGLNVVPEQLIFCLCRKCFLSIEAGAVDNHVAHLSVTGFDHDFIRPFRRLLHVFRQQLIFPVLQDLKHLIAAILFKRIERFTVILRRKDLLDARLQIMIELRISQDFKVLRSNLQFLHQQICLRLFRCKNSVRITSGILITPALLLEIGNDRLFILHPRHLGDVGI